MRQVRWTWRGGWKYNHAFLPREDNTALCGRAKYGYYACTFIQVGRCPRCEKWANKFRTELAVKDLLDEV